MKQRLLFNRPIIDIIAGVVFVFVVGLFIWSALWAYREFISSPPYVDPVKYPIRGIDVSAHNGEINFSKVAESGIKFAFIKASEGTDFNDKNFKRNFVGAQREGLKTGAYHFFRFDKEGVPQAINLIGAIGKHMPDLGVVIDVEDTGNPDTVPIEKVKERLFSMVDYLHLSGYRVMIYTNHNGYYDYIADVLPGIPLWICRFSENPINAEWTFWQYDHHGKIDGIKGDVDLNAFCGTEEEWHNYLGGDVWPYTNSNVQ